MDYVDLFSDPKPRKKARVSVQYEAAEQAALFDWAARNIAKYPELYYLHASANGGKRDKRTAGMLQKTGVKPGVPDIELPVPRGGYHGLYIELKAIYPDGSEGHASKEQERWIKFLQAQGYRAAVIAGWEAAARFIEDYLNL